jgi:hypothetical protein
MGVSAQQGPLWVYGQRPTIGAAGSNNPDVGPSGFWGGIGIIDGRVGYNVTTMGGVMWYGSDPVAIDQVPSALTTAGIAAAQVPVSGTPLTLVSASGAGITVLSTATYIYGSGNIAPVGALAIDGLPGIVQIGSLAQLSTGVTRLKAYDPTKAISRAVRITSVGNDSGATITIVGADLYGFPQTQTLTMANAGSVATTKAFKFIYSATPNGTLSGSNVSIGQTDIFGMPILTPSWGAYVTIFWAGAALTAATGFVAPDATSPATASTGDVRGTLNLTSVTGGASDGTKRMQVIITPAVANTLTNVGLFGVVPA